MRLVIISRVKVDTENAHHKWSFELMHDGATPIFISSPYLAVVINFDVIWKKWRIERFFLKYFKTVLQII